MLKWEKYAFKHTVHIEWLVIFSFRSLWLKLIRKVREVSDLSWCHTYTFCSTFTNRGCVNLFPGCHVSHLPAEAAQHHPLHHRQGPTARLRQRQGPRLAPAERGYPSAVSTRLREGRLTEREKSESGSVCGHLQALYFHGNNIKKVYHQSKLNSQGTSFRTRHGRTHARKRTESQSFCYEVAILKISGLCRKLRQQFKQ